jgi:hypothetical protein
MQFAITLADRVFIYSTYQRYTTNLFKPSNLLPATSHFSLSILSYVSTIISNSLTNPLTQVRTTKGCINHAAIPFSSYDPSFRSSFDSKIFFLLFFSYAVPRTKLHSSFLLDFSTLFSAPCFLHLLFFSSVYCCVHFASSILALSPSLFLPSCLSLRQLESSC